MKPKKSSVENIAARRNALRKIILELQYRGEPITRKVLLDELAKKGFVIDIATLYRDRAAINHANTFVEDIAESEYSAMQEDIYSKLVYVEEQALEMYSQDWRIRKVVSRKLPDGRNTEESSMVVDEFRPKMQCLGLIKDVQALKQNALKGENMQLAVTLVGKKFSQVKEELALVTKERNKLKEPNNARRN